MKILQRILYGVCAVILLGVAGLFVAPNVPYFGNFDIKIVKSGSMEPSIMTGGIVMMKESASYVVGDVITFVTPGADIPTTHRIMEVVQEGGQTGFITKGDANEENDTAIVRPQNVIGKVFFSMPYVGFLLDFARQPLGFSLLIGIPALLIVIDEVEKIWREVRGMRRRKHEGDDDEDFEVDDEVPAQALPAPSSVPLSPRVARVVDMRRVVPVVEVTPPLTVRSLSFTPTLPARKRSAYSLQMVGTVAIPSLLFFFVIFAVSSLFVKSTLSYFNDTERSIGNTFGAIAVHFSVITNQTVFNFFDTDAETSEATLESEVVLESGSVPLQYVLSVEYATGTMALCDAIVASTNDLAAPYAGSLLALGASGELLNTWGLDLNLAPGAYAPGDVCEVDMVYGGWNATQPIPIAYEDTERVRLSFIAPAGASLQQFSIMMADEVSEEVAAIIDEEPTPDIASTSTEQEVSEVPRPAEAMAEETPEALSGDREGEVEQVVVTPAEIEEEEVALETTQEESVATEEVSAVE